jgi:hypothetical protein
MSLEMAHKVIVPKKKIMSRSFLNSGTLIVNFIHRKLEGWKKIVFSFFSGIVPFPKNLRMINSSWIKFPKNLICGFWRITFNPPKDIQPLPPRVSIPPPPPNSFAYIYHQVQTEYSVKCISMDFGYTWHKDSITRIKIHWKLNKIAKYGN